MIHEIRTLSDVEKYTKELISEDTSFLPNDDFCDYINLATGKPTYTKSEGEFKNKLMKECFQVYSDNKVDIYSFMTEILLKETGMNDLIPFPSHV